MSKQRYSRTVIVWGVRSRYDVNERARMNYSIIIVDPKQCSYKPVKTYEEEFLYGSGAYKSLQEVLTHDDSFDVIYTTVRICTPCRYSLDGKMLDVRHKIEPELSGDHPAITSCYYESMRSHPPKGQKVNCERFDGKLQSVFSTNLPLLAKHDPSSVSLAIDDSGNSFVAVIESNIFGTGGKYRLYELDSTGKVTNVINLGEMERPNFYGGYKLRGFVYNKQYCFEITKSTIWNPMEADEKEIVKCIAI